MKLLYRDPDGTLFSGVNHNRVVVSMRRAAWKAPGKATYMEDVARRVACVSKGRWRIATGSAEEFLASLVAAGLLVRV